MKKFSDFDLDLTKIKVNNTNTKGLSGYFCPPTLDNAWDCIKYSIEKCSKYPLCGGPGKPTYSASDATMCNNATKLNEDILRC